MPTLLEDLVIDRVDLVDEGANSAAFIQLYKRRKEQGDTMNITEILEKMAPEHSAVVQAEFDKLNADIAKAADDVKAAEEAKTTAETACAKAEEDLKTTNDTLTNTQGELDTLKGAGAAFDETETFKSMPAEAKEYLTKMRTQKEAAEETLRKAKESEENAVAIAKAAELKALPVEQDKLIGILKNCSPELLEVLKTVNAAVNETVLGEVGKSSPGHVSATSEEAWGKIEVKASEIAKTASVTKAKAVAMAIEANPDLYKEYLKGGAN